MSGTESAAGAATPIDAAPVDATPVEHAERALASGAPRTPIEMLWAPTPAQIDASRIAEYLHWLGFERDLHFHDYEGVWRWSVNQPEAFWRSIWDFFDVQADGEREPVLASAQMPGASWFPNVRINYAEHVFRCASSERPAIVCRTEDEPLREVHWAELMGDTAALAATLRTCGVQAGDRVASYLPNCPETIVAFLACACIGAVWSSCAPEMGVQVVLDRFRQIEPKVLFTADSYRYNGKVHDRAAQVGELLRELPSVVQVIHVDGPLSRASRTTSSGVPDSTVVWRDCMSWHEAVHHEDPAGAVLSFERLPFDHPLWIVYSSGTTGLPKAIVHGHGGIVVTQLKTLGLQHDVRPGDRMMFLGSTGWIVWNMLVGGLVAGATIVLYDGNPAWPDNKAVWRFVDEQRVTLFGCGAAFLTNCMKAGLAPGEFASFEALRSINSTGSPLSVDGYRWVYDAIKPDLWLASVSGGTDIASGFVACSPMLPVYAGEIQCRELAVAAYSFNEAGEPVVDEVGELVVTQPIPSMPVMLWNDPQMQRYRESYFEMFPGYWRHGDWIRFTPRGTSIIYGRSDSTINRYGIRIGTAEIYRVVEELPEVLDSLVIDLEYLGRPSLLLLFVVLRPEQTLDAELQQRIVGQIRSKASARHVPDETHAVGEIPRTLTGKKMEVPVRKILLGLPANRVASPDAMANPGSLGYFVSLAGDLAARPIP